MIALSYQLTDTHHQTMLRCKAYIHACRAMALLQEIADNRTRTSDLALDNALGQHNKDITNFDQQY
ncbi:PPE domain-containing protein [Mycobacterium uberis]|uniref:PPE domain-containing protein n=1 Tax=Mycobacterium uberis TaxID=2162698 RepID=UPI003C71939A